MLEMSKASLKGADRFGELPYREPVASQPSQDASKEVGSIPQSFAAKKAALQEERKKLWAQQRTLDEDKRKLASNMAALKQKIQISTQAN
jgi:hypothetical protein